MSFECFNSFRSLVLQEGAALLDLDPPTKPRPPPYQRALAPTFASDQLSEVVRAQSPARRHESYEIVEKGFSSRDAMINSGNTLAPS